VPSRRCLLRRHSYECHELPTILADFRLQTTALSDIQHDERASEIAHPSDGRDQAQPRQRIAFVVDRQAGANASAGSSSACMDTHARRHPIHEEVTLHARWGPKVEM
jgi:hypothetical protein